MIKEIGSTYWLSQDVIDSLSDRIKTNPIIYCSEESLVSTCRSAIGLILDKIEPIKKVALLPAFTCESVLSSFLKRGYKVYPYPIAKDLKVEWQGFRQAVEKWNPTVVLVHSYFGFNTLEELNDKVSELQSENMIVIEDRTQSMFSRFVLPKADYYVGSIRKWMPIPDGAFVTISFSGKEEDKELCEAKLKAFRNKGNWILYGIGSKADFRKDFSIAEHILDSRDKPYAMSNASKSIYGSTDLMSMKRIRRANYELLVSKIAEDEKLKSHLKMPLPEMNETVCPFHLPVIVENNRESLQKFLASNDIYATVIWGCPKEFENLINDDAKYIYDHILCFHVDQRYDYNDMMRIVDTLKHYYNS
jgi:hypothetical protein